MCGIAGIVVLRDGQAPPAIATTCCDGRRAASPRPGRVRRLPRRARRPRPRPAVHHRPRDRPAAALQRGRLAVDRLQRRDLQLRRAARRARWRAATASAPRATPRSSSTPTRVGRGRLRALQRPVRHRALGRCGAERLVLARDRFGIRPLYLCEHARSALFASEVKAIFAADPAIPRALDPSGLDETFTFWTTVAPQTVFAGHQRARARSRATVSRQGMRDRAYWSQPLRRRRRRAASPASLRGCRRRGARAPSRRGPAAHAAGRRAGGQLPLGRPRQLGRGGPRSDASASDLPHVLGALRGRGVRRDPLPARDGRSDLGSRAPRDRRRSRPTSPRPSRTVVCHAERPLLRTAPAPLFLLSGLVRQSGIKVVLTGEGADEVFAGYDLFREAKVRRFWGRQPASSSAAALARAALPVPGPLAGGPAGDGARVLRPRT